MGTQRFIKFATRPSSIVREVPIIFFLTHHGLRRFLSIPLDKEKSDYYVDAATYKKCLKRILQLVISDVEKYISNYPLYKERLLQKARKVEKNVPQGGRLLWKTYSDYCDFVSEYSIYFISTFAIEESIIPELAKLYPDEINLILSVDKPFAYHSMRRDLTEKDTRTVWRKYAWMNMYNFHEDDYPLEYFQKLKQTTDKKEIAHTFSEIAENRKRFRSFYKTCSYAHIREKVLLAHECAFIKTDRVDAWRLSMWYVRSLFRKIAEEKGWPTSYATNLTQEEIKSILLEKKYPPEEEILLRSEKKCVLDISGETLKIIYEPKTVAQLRELVKEDVPKRSELKGVVASRGYARGKAVIVTDRTMLSKLKAGDVIVAFYTTPDYVSAMKSAGAVITEEGGMTSHAAVISRELKKPCVMNVKNATKILRDGDMVEVDADKGVVKVVKRD